MLPPRLSGLLGLSAAALLVVALVAPTPTSASEPLPEDDGDPTLTALAAVNDLTLPQVQEVLADPAAQLTDSGRIWFADPVGRVDTAERPVLRQAASLGRTFRLHSKAGSRRTIYLDFDGHTVRGTAWNRSAGVRAGRHQGWDPSRNGPAFTIREKRAIQSIWARVAEDYAPFDVDVTTQRPAEARIHRDRRRDKVFGTRVLVSDSRQAHGRICGSTCGGAAFLNVFSATGGAHRRHQPTWVFPASLGNDVKAVAEAATHEAGHTFGLLHDGVRGLLGLNTPYYGGHGIWSPIMGVSYERPITQWSRGSYDGATTRQDDIRMIARRGAPIRRDEAGSRPRSAARRLPAGPAYISRSSDVDVFRLGSCRGRIRLRVSVARTSPNLDARLRLIRNGRTIATADPRARRVSRDRARGMSARMSRAVKRGNYFVAVDGVGLGDPATSYDDYGSVGAYRLRVRGC